MSCHLWLALSPHGFGHAAMTAPIIERLQQMIPGLRLTIQTSLDPAFVASRYQNYDLVDWIDDFGLAMHSSTSIDIGASAQAYGQMMGQYEDLVARQARILGQGAPNLVLANIPFITLAGAQAAGIPAMAYSSVNWLDMHCHYLSHSDDAGKIQTRMRAAYEYAECFLRPEPAQPMSLSNIRDIGTVAKAGHPDRGRLRQNLGLDEGTRIGLVAFGGIAHPIDWLSWPRLAGWFWLGDRTVPETRADLACWDDAGLDFSGLLASVDMVITKTGYGTFTEAALSGIPVLYQSRPDWPEAAPLESWLEKHTRCLPLRSDWLSEGILASQLHSLFLKPKQKVASFCGVETAAGMISDRLLQLSM